jgi:hypothetical protein
MSDRRPRLDALSAAEKAAVLEEILAVRPNLRELAEACATRLMKDARRPAIAGDVESALKWLDIGELNNRVGHRLGSGYIHPVEAASEILDEALQPFLDDLKRRADLGMGSAATEVAAGILLGLYGCREGGSETLLEYVPDYAAERASVVASDCIRLSIDLPARRTPRSHAGMERPAVLTRVREDRDAPPTRSARSWISRLGLDAPVS